uniref:Secreted protein n=1 Tax=Romanomermis culicivorax TaxID=13658 RepID=A0A915K6Q1_ROMCU
MFKTPSSWNKSCLLRRAFNLICCSSNSRNEAAVSRPATCKASRPFKNRFKTCDTFLITRADFDSSSWAMDKMKQSSMWPSSNATAFFSSTLPTPFLVTSLV